MAELGVYLHILKAFQTSSLVHFSMCTNLLSVPIPANIFRHYLLKLDITDICFCSKPTSNSLWFDSLNLLFQFSSLL